MITVLVRFTLPDESIEEYRADRWYPTREASLAATVRSVLSEVATDNGGVVVPESVAVEVTCPCGKPSTHLDADPDSSEWACRVPHS